MGVEPSLTAGDGRQALADPYQRLTLAGLSPSPIFLIWKNNVTEQMCSRISEIKYHAFGGRLRLVPRIRITKAARRVSPVAPSYSKTTITCCGAQPETLKTVQSIIAKQLSIDESTVAPETKFIDLGADSLDTVEIMMALEEKFGVSIGEGGAENIATVQDAADLIEKVKTASA
ncbi:acyl carrier protein, chloroplastic-like [Eucalyptus grandis]|uniref:acyl carrier protein, chloroplastic-like n=1 Tax=Eucalyptus grandis TaxID=71139 RepID=UPI00192ED8B6|nr:acyl carrier protein, chloroplastic-like [Eucalyptus grandis]